MEHTTFAKKTVVLAALGALSLMAATVRAADETETDPAPEAKTIEVTIGSGASEGTVIGSTIDNANEKVEWSDVWLKEVLKENETFGGLTFKDAGRITVSGDGSFSIDLPTKEETAAGNDGKYVTFNGVNLTLKDGGSFSNSSHLKFTESGSLTFVGADFSNGKEGVITFEGTTFSIDAGFSLDPEDKDALGNFENAGLIILDADATKTGATMYIGSTESALREVTSEDKFSLNVGNVEIKSGTLINYDKGYQVTKGTGGKAEGDAEGEDAAPVQTLVKFGTVTVAKDGKFVNAADAFSEGSALVLEAEDTVKIDGTSVWNTLNLSNVGAGKAVNNYVDIVKNDDESVGGDFRVTGALVIDKFAEGGEFTINGSSDARVFADGIGITAGSHVTANDLKQETSGGKLVWTAGDAPTVGTLKLMNFVATPTSEGETTEPGTPEDQAESGEDQTKPTESWTHKKFGDVTVVNSNIEISQNQTKWEKVYTPSIEMDSLQLLSTSVKVDYDVEVKMTDIQSAVNSAWDSVKGDSTENIEIDWTKDDALEQLEALLEKEEYAALKKELEGKRDSFENGLAGVLTDVHLDTTSTIANSDLAIGTLQIARDSQTVEVDKKIASESTGAGDNQGPDSQVDDDAEESVDSVSITGDKTYDLGDLTLNIEKSNLDVDVFDLQTGTVTLEGTTMMVGNVKEINGALTFKSGYLGLNVTKSVAEHLSLKNDAESKANTEPANATVEVGSPVAIGENGKFTIGGEAFTYKPAEDKDAVEYAVGIAGNADIIFDGKNFNSEALFSQTRTDGNKGIVAVNGTDTKLTVKATNLSWGVYKLFDEDTLNTDALKGKVSVDTTSEDTVNGLWKDAVEAKGDEGITVKDNNLIVVGGTTIEGSGLDIGAVNLANSVVGGDRGSALDKALFNHILSNGQSLEEISNTINSITAMGAVAGLTAMTVDFGAYVTDQVEHHASTIPHQQEGWWVQPIAGKLKSDDLAVGGMKSGYSIDTVGIMGGFDKKLRNGDTIGVAASYQSGDADSEGEGLPVATDVTNYGLHLWHARQFDAYRLMGMFSYSKTSGDAKMNYAGNELTSDLGATEISIGARADKEFKWNTVRMIPHVGVRASMIDVDDYTIEMGSEELFKVSEDKLWIFEVPVGVTFASSFEYARWNVQPYVDLTVRGRFGDTDSTFTLEGSNTSDSMKYDVTGDVIGDLRIGYMSTFQDLNLGMSYGLSAGDGGRQNHQIEATLRLDF